MRKEFIFSVRPMLSAQALPHDTAWSGCSHGVLCPNLGGSDWGVRPQSRSVLLPLAQAQTSESSSASRASSKTASIHANRAGDFCPLLKTSELRMNSCNQYGNKNTHWSPRAVRYAFWGPVGSPGPQPHKADSSHQPRRQLQGRQEENPGREEHGGLLLDHTEFSKNLQK